MLLGLFLLIAKYANPELWGEGESGGLQKGAELLGKEKEKERRREKGIDKTGKYNIKESGIGDSWKIGDDSTWGGNAYVKSMSGCEETLIIPYELTDESGKKKYVEVIGQWAFYSCGSSYYGGITRSIVTYIPYRSPTQFRVGVRYVRQIKHT